MQLRSTFLVVACAAALTSSLAFAGLGSASGAVSSDVRVGSFNVVGVNNDTNASGEAKIWRNVVPWSSPRFSLRSSTSLACRKPTRASRTSLA